MSRGCTEGAAEAYRILTACLRRVHAGERWTMDSWREQADLTQLSSREKARAHERACEDGYLVALGAVVGGAFHTFSIRSTHKAGHGRRVIVYARTTKSLPGQPALELHHDHHHPGQVQGQANLLELVEEEGVTV